MSGTLTGAIVFMILQTTTASQMPHRRSAPPGECAHAEAALYAPANIVMPSSRTIAPVSGGG